MTDIRIKVGTAPVSWGIMEVDGWSEQQPYGSVLDEMREALYSGTELGPYGYFPSEPDRLRAELKERGLDLVAAFVPIPLSDGSQHEAALAEVMRTAELLAEAGARKIVLADAMSRERMAVAGRVSASDGMSDEQWEEAARTLARAARSCQALGLDAVFHHHAGTYIETPDEIERLSESVDADLLGLCLDTGHYYYGGGDPVDAVRKYGSRIRHLHLKDVRPDVLEEVRRDGVDFLEAVRRGVFCELGEGAIDFSYIISALTAEGFNGWAIVEQDIDPSRSSVKPLESAIRSRKFLRQRIGL